MNRKYNKERLEEAVKSSTSWAGTLRYLGIADTGGSRTNLKKNVAYFSISTEHFTGQGHRKGKTSPKKKNWSEYLVERQAGSRRLGTSVLRRSMIEFGFKYSCYFEDCPTHSGWINGPIDFEIDHIDGNNLDNRPENLRFLCAICHSQQPTSSSSWKNAERFGTSTTCSCGNPKRYSARRCITCYQDSRKALPTSVHMV